MSHDNILHRLSIGFSVIILTVLSVLSANAQSLGRLSSKTPLRQEDRDSEEYQYVEISPDGKYVVGVTNGAYSGGRLSVWTISDRKEIFTLPFGSNAPAVAWAARSLESRSLLAVAVDERDESTGDERAFAQVILFPEGSVQKKFELPENVYSKSIALSADGIHLALGSFSDSDGRVWVYKVDEGTTTGPFQAFEDRLSSMAFIPGKPLLATGGKSSNSGLTLKLWDVTTCDMFASSRWQKEQVIDVEASWDGKRIAAVSEDDNVKVFDVQPGALRVLDSYEHDVYRSKCIRYTNNGSRLWFANGRAFTVWDADTRQQVLTQGLSEFGSMDVTPDGRIAVICGESFDATPDVLDADAILRFLAPASSRKAFDDEFSYEIHGMTVSHDNAYLTLMQDYDGLVLWDIKKQRLIDTLKFSEHDIRKESVVVSPDMATYFQSTYDPMIRRRRFGQTSESLLRLPEDEYTRTAAVSCNGDFSAFGTSENRVLVFDRNFKLAKTLNVSRLSGTIAVSPDGHWLAMENDVQVFDLQNGNELGTWDGDGIAGFTPDSRLLFGRFDNDGGYGGGIWKLDLETGTRSEEYPLPAPSKMKLSSKAPYFVASSGNLVRVFNYRSARLLGTLRGHEDDVLCLAISSDGKTAYSGDKAGKLLTWDLSKWVNEDEKLGTSSGVEVASRPKSTTWDTKPRVYNTNNGIRITIEPTSESEQTAVQESLREVLRQIQTERP